MPDASRNLIAALLLAASFVYGAARLSDAIVDAVREQRAGQRSVTVKGLAEREVEADLAIWPITFTAAEHELAALQKLLDQHTATTVAFLTQRGFSDNEVNVSAPAVTDLWAQQYKEPGGAPRYSAQVTVMLRTTRVKELDRAARDGGELVKRGVVLSGNYGQGAQYFFTGLNAVKPQMIADATENARKAAEQFAKDSKSRVGAIKSAQQGFFSIEDRDPHTPQIKKVRVVTTVDYLLAGE